MNYRVSSLKCAKEQHIFLTCSLKEAPLDYLKGSPQSLSESLSESLSLSQSPLLRCLDMYANVSNGSDMFWMDGRSAISEDFL